MTFPGAFPGSYRGRTNDIKTRRSTATARLHMQACALEGRTVSGTHYPDVLLILFLHGHSWILNYSFFQGEEPSRFPGLIWTGRAMPFPGGTAHKIHLARTKQTTHRREPHTHSTQLDTLKHTLRELGRQSALASPQPGFLERVPRYVT